MPGIGLGIGTGIKKAASEKLGAELLTNGDFHTNDFTGWNTPGAEWDASTGAAVCDGSQSPSTTLLQKSGFLPDTIGKYMRVEFDLVVTAGQIEPAFGTNKASAKTVSGHYVDRGIVSVVNTVRFYGSAAFIGSIDNVSYKEIL